MTPSSLFVELDKSVHDRKSFDCGTNELNVFLQQFAVRHRASNISKTMVLPSVENPAHLCAYYTLSHTEVCREKLPQSLSKKLPMYPIPVMLIAKLAVHNTLQGSGLGAITLIRALNHAYKINHHLPSYAVVVDAIDNAVRSFYEQYGFQPLDIVKERPRLFLPMKQVANLFERQ